MSPTEQKALFLQQDYHSAIRQIPSGMQPLFGKMDPQQMIEHMAEHIRQGYGNPVISGILTPAEQLSRMQAFLLSDKPFRENTPNVFLPDTPAPHQHVDIGAATEDLQRSIDELFLAFDTAPDKEVTNPFFGVLDYTLTIHLLYKHAWHHLRQFGIMPPLPTNS